MTLTELAGRLLKGSGYTQSHSARSLSLDQSFVERERERELVSSTGKENTRLSDTGGMTCGFGEPRGQSICATSWARIRPLSDIRELTEPSLADTIPKKLLSDATFQPLPRPDLSRKQSATSKPRPIVDARVTETWEHDRTNSVEYNDIASLHREQLPGSPTPPSAVDDNSITSIYSIPPATIPPRSSSRVRACGASQPRQTTERPTTHNPQQPSGDHVMEDIPMIPLPPSKGSGLTIRRHGQSRSPLRHVAARLDPVSHESNRRVPSRTFHRQPVSKEMLEFPTHRHPRIELGLDLTAGIFVGGGSIEGTAQIRIDDAERIRHRRTLDIARISVDLLGIEEMNSNRRCVFLNLASELIDEDHPPPANMVDSQEPISSGDMF